MRVTYPASVKQVFRTICFASLLFLTLPLAEMAGQAWIHTRKDGPWDDPNTWQGGVVPGPGDNVFIQRDVTISADVEVNDFKILMPGNVDPSGSTPITLTVNGIFDVKSGFNHNNLINVYLSGTGLNQALECGSFFGITVDGSYQIQSNTVISGMLYVTPNGSLTDNGLYVIDLTKADTAFLNEGSVVLTSTVRYSGTANQYVTGATYGNLELTGTGTTKTAIGDITVQDSMLVDAGTTLEAGSSTITLNGDGSPFTLNGTFDYGTSTVNYAYAGDQYITDSPYYNLQATGSGIKYLAGSPTIYGDLTFSAQIEAGSDTLHIQGSYLSVSGGYISGALFSVRFFGSGDSRMVTTSQLQQDVTHLIIQKSSGGDTVRVEAAAAGYDAAVKTNATGNLDIYSGVFDLGTAYLLRVSGTTQTGRYLQKDGTTIRVAGSESMPYFSTAGGSGPLQHASYTIGARSTWELYGGNQNVRGVGQGIPAYGNLVLKSAGTKTQIGNVNILTSLVRTSPSYYSLGGNALTYYTGAALWYVLSDSTGPGFQVEQYTADDEFPVSGGPTDVVIANSMNVNLHANRSIPGFLRLADGKFILGVSNFTLSATGTVQFANETRYVVTNSTGFLVKTNLGSTAFFFPIGPDVNAYDPVTLANDGTVDTYSARVQSWMSYSPYDPTKVVERQWTLTEAVIGGSNLTASFRWDHTEQAAAFDPAATVLLLRSIAGAWGESFGTSVSGTGFYTATTSGISQLTDFILSNDAFLPVELTSFTAHASAGSVRLDWHTASELNNAGFELFRREPEGLWRRIGFVSGYGTTSEPQDYRFIDDFQDLTVRGEQYEYMLRQVDLDGMGKDSKVLKVRLKSIATDAPVMYPSPCTSVSYIAATTTVPGPVTVAVYDARGTLQNILLDGQHLSAGKHYVRFDRGSLPPGMYFCRIEAAKGSRTLKFQIAR